MILKRHGVSGQAIDKLKRFPAYLSGIILSVAVLLACNSRDSITDHDTAGIIAEIDDSISAGSTNTMTLIEQRLSETSDSNRILRNISPQTAAPGNHLQHHPRQHAMEPA